MNDDRRRLFLAFEVQAPWPIQFPEGRLLASESRHLTLIFLNKANLSKTISLLNNFPAPSWPLGLTGIFDRPLFLPPRHPRVAAWHVTFFDDQSPNLIDYYYLLLNWFKSHQYDLKEYPLLPHVTIARKPFNITNWESAFHRLPMMVTDLHLYESMGNLKYLPRWTYHLPAPFKITGDNIIVYGSSVGQLYRHALIALAFKKPVITSKILAFDTPPKDFDELEASLESFLAKACLEKATINLSPSPLTQSEVMEIIISL
ncbi:MAG: 2'-5' RNA ligase family protein [Chlamydiota bacterium]